MYYFYGNEEYLIQKKIEEIIKKNPSNNIIKINNDFKLEEIINQIINFSLFEKDKILIFNNPYFLTKEVSENEINSIIKALKIKPNSTKIIFSSEKIQNSKNELLSFLKKEANCMEFNELKEKEIIEIAKQKIIDLEASISEIDLFYLLSKLPNKLILIINEIEKLVALDKNISKSNIDYLVQKYNIDTTFSFINSFHNKDANEIFKTYYQKINQGETIQNLINQISNVLELCSRIYSLKKMNFSNQDIEKIMNKHSFVIKKNMEFLDYIGYKKIVLYTNLISEIDQKIKKNEVDEKIAFERFLLEIIK